MNRLQLILAGVNLLVSLLKGVAKSHGKKIDDRQDKIGKLLLEVDKHQDEIKGLMDESDHALAVAHNIAKLIAEPAPAK